MSESDSEKIGYAGFGERKRGAPAGVGETAMVITRAPAEFAEYLRLVGSILYRRQTYMYRTLISQFLDERPWEHGMPWSRPHSAGRDSNDTRWVQVNINLDRALSERMDEVCAEFDISKSALALTAMVWIVKVVHPPREAAAEASEGPAAGDG